MEKIKTVIITGTNSGMGLELVKKRLSIGDRVIATVKDNKMKHRLRKDLTKYIKYEDQLFVRCLDLTNSDSINIFCSEIIHTFEYIDALVCNACKMISSHFKTADGYERHMQLHFIANLALTIKLLPVLVKSSLPCVIQICENPIHRTKIKSFDTLLQKAKIEKALYDPIDSYYTSKMAQLLLAQYLQLEFPLRSFAVHPSNHRYDLSRSNNRLLSPIKRLYNNFIKGYIYPDQDVRTTNAILNAPDKYENGQFYRRRSIIDTDQLFLEKGYVYEIVDNFAKHLELLT